jgi:hypothetical protein
VLTAGRQRKLVVDLLVRHQLVQQGHRGGRSGDTAEQLATRDLVL